MKEIYLRCGIVVRIYTRKLIAAERAELWQMPILPKFTRSVFAVSTFIIYTNIRTSARDNNETIYMPCEYHVNWKFGNLIVYRNRKHFFFTFSTCWWFIAARAYTKKNCLLPFVVCIPKFFLGKSCMYNFITKAANLLSQRNSINR